LPGPASHRHAAGVQPGLLGHRQRRPPGPAVRPPLPGDRPPDDLEGAPMTDASRSPEPMIRLESLTKRYPGQAVPAVDGITLDIPKGEIVVLVGPSGCGKTTVIKMINALIAPTSGRGLIGADVVPRRHMVHVIPQVGLFPH